MQVDHKTYLTFKLANLLRAADRGYKKPVLLLHPLGGWTKDDDVPLKVTFRFSYSSNTYCINTTD